jgi:hypothetical protein
LLRRSLDEVPSVDFELVIAANPAGGFDLLLRTRPRDGGPARERTLHAESCDEACDAAAVAIALAITGEAPEPETRTGAAHPSPPAASTTPPPRAVQDAALRLSVALGLALDGAVLPSPAPGAQLELGAGYGPFELRAYGMLLTSQRAELADRSGGGELGLITAGALLCGGRALSELALMVCAGGELGSLAAEGVDLDQSEERSAAFRAIRADAGAGLRLGGPFWVVGRAGVSVPLTRDEFQVNRGQRLHQAAKLSLRVWLGAQMEL